MWATSDSTLVPNKQQQPSLHAAGAGGSGPQETDMTNAHLESLVRHVWEDNDDDGEEEDIVLGRNPNAPEFHQRGTQPQQQPRGFQTPTDRVSTRDAPLKHGGPGYHQPSIFATPPTQKTSGLSPLVDENLGTTRRTPEKIKAMRAQQIGATTTSFRSGGSGSPPPVDSSFGSFTVTSHDDSEETVSLKPGLRRGMGTPQQQVVHHHRVDPMRFDGPSSGGYQSSTGVTPAMQLDEHSMGIHDLAPTNIVHVRDISWKPQGPSNTDNKYKVFIQNLEPKTSKQDLMQIFFPFGGAEAEIQTFCPPGARRQGICYFSSELLAVSGASKLNNFVPHGQTQPLICAYDDEPWGQGPGEGGNPSAQESTPGLSSVATLHNASATTVRSSTTHNSSASELSVDQSIHSATMAALNANHGGGGHGSPRPSPMFNKPSVVPANGPLPGSPEWYRTRAQQGLGGTPQSFTRQPDASAAPFHPQHPEGSFYPTGTGAAGVTMPGAAGTLGQGRALQYALQAAGMDPSAHWSNHPAHDAIRDPSACLRLLLQKTPGVPQRTNLVNDIFDQFLLQADNSYEITALTKVMLEHLKYHQQEGMRLLRHLINKFNEPANKHLRSRYLDPLSRPIVSVLLTSEDKPERIGVAIVVADLFDCGFIGGTPFGMARKLTQAQMDGTAARKDPDLIDALISMTTAWATTHSERKPTEDERLFCGLVTQHYNQPDEEDAAAGNQAEGTMGGESSGDSGHRTPPAQMLESDHRVGRTTPSESNKSLHMSEEEARHLAAMTTPPQLTTGGGGGGSGVQVGTPEAQLSTPGTGGNHAKMEEDVVACTVYITRVPPGTAEAKLRNIFCECGDINKVRLYEDKQSRGAFGFVEFGSPVAATKMIRLNDRRHVDSSRMRCNAARNAIHDSDSRDAIIDHLTGARIRDCLFGLSAKPQNVVVRTNRGFFAQ